MSVNCPIYFVPMRFGTFGLSSLSYEDLMQHESPVKCNVFYNSNFFILLSSFYFQVIYFENNKSPKPIIDRERKYLALKEVFN